MACDACGTIALSGLSQGSDGSHQDDRYRLSVIEHRAARLSCLLRELFKLNRASQIASLYLRGNVIAPMSVDRIAAHPEVSGQAVETRAGPA